MSAVPDGFYNAAKQTAAARGRNLSDVVRQALQDYITQPPSRRRRPEQSVRTS